MLLGLFAKKKIKKKQKHETMVLNQYEQTDQTFQFSNSNSI